MTGDATPVRDGETASGHQDLRPKNTAREAWTEFLLGRVASYEQTIRFFVTSFVAVVAVILVQFFLIVDRDIVQDGTLSLGLWAVLRAGWLVVFIFLLSILVWRSVSLLGDRRSLALQTVISLLGNEPLDESVRPWTRQAGPVGRFPLVRHLI